jgi:hypothetical protein
MFRDAAADFTDMIIVVNQKQVHRRRGTVVAHFALEGHFLNATAAGWIL